MSADGIVEEPKLGHEKYNAVYERATPELYDSWARDGYDEDVASASIAVASVVGKYLSLAEKEQPLRILDVGCGTGRVAEVLAEEAAKFSVNITSIDGVDYSRGMLDVAMGKKTSNGSSIYERLVQADVKKDLDANVFISNSYDGMLCSGVFLQGHVGPEALPELCRILKPGGILCFSVRPTYFKTTAKQWKEMLERHGAEIISTEMMDYAANGFKAPVLICRKN